MGFAKFIWELWPILPHLLWDFFFFKARKGFPWEGNRSWRRAPLRTDWAKLSDTVFSMGTLELSNGSLTSNLWIATWGPARERKMELEHRRCLLIEWAALVPWSFQTIYKRRFCSKLNKKWRDCPPDRFLLWPSSSRRRLQGSHGDNRSNLIGATVLWIIWSLWWPGPSTNAKNYHYASSSYQTDKQIFMLTKSAGNLLFRRHLPWG